MAITKKAIKEIQVVERKKMRKVFANSRWTQVTGSKYDTLRNLVRKETASPKAELEFTKDEFRDWLHAAETSPSHWMCAYCHDVFTLSKLAIDHRKSRAKGGKTTFANLAIVDQSCNWQKGCLPERSFLDLLDFLRGWLTPDEAQDVKQRLSIGGKWMKHN